MREIDKIVLRRFIYGVILVIVYLCAKHFLGINFYDILRSIMGIK